MQRLASFQRRELAFVVIKGRLDLVELLAERFGLLPSESFFLFHLGFELLILAVGVGQNLLAHDFEEADQEAAGTAGRVANHVPLLGLDHANHEFDDGARGEELPNLARKVRPKEPLEGDAFDVLAGVGKVVAFQAA